ncbi:unnamed protein product [Symbiodinium natans]|uniref:Uncharacterized protein n=1 Tax=Symbiodinium natans TaxID=878477 RepID=A0A812LL58_9DINO|nr:unnamed protein product [Symbiodinium natans]
MSSSQRARLATHTAAAVWGASLHQKSVGVGKVQTVRVATFASGALGFLENPSEREY